MYRKLCSIYNKYELPIVGIVWIMVVSFLIFCAYSRYIRLTMVVQLVFVSVILLVYIIFDRYQSENSLYKSDYSMDQYLCNLPILNRKLELMLRILFAVVIVSLLLTLQFFDVRPLSYFVMCSIIAGIISILILFTDNNKSSILSLIRIGIFSLLTSLSIFKIYYFVGNDTWAHAAWNELIAFTGAMDPTMGKEFGYPLYHIFVALYQILGSVDVRMATIICVSIPTILTLIVVFALGQKFVGKKLALISTLVLTLFPAYIQSAIVGTSTSAGSIIIYFLVLTYVLWIFSKDRKYANRYLAIYFALVVVLSLTHQFSAFMFLTTLIGVYLASVMRVHKIVTKELLLTLSTMLTMMIVWLSVSYGFTQMVAIITEQFFSLSSSTESIVSATSSYMNIQPPNDFQMAVDYGQFYLYMVALVICYICFKSFVKSTIRNQSWHYLIIVSLVSLILTLAIFAATVLGAGMAERYARLLVLFAALSVAYILYYICSKLSSRKQLIICAISLCIIISCFALVALPTSTNATDNPVLIDGKDRVQGVSVSELQAMKTMSISLQFMADDTVYLENPEISRAFEYVMGKIARTEGEVIHSIRDVTNIDTINWDLLDLDDGEYLIYRTLLSDRPAYQYITYATGKEHGQIYQPTDINIAELGWYNNIIYDNFALYWIHGF